MLAPLDHQRRATLFALLVRGLLHPLDVLHVLFGILEILLEFLVEVGQGVGPLLFAFFDFVEFLFQTRGVLHIENVAEVFDQQIGDDQADFGRRKFAADFLHVLPLLNGGENRRVGRRAADAALFEFFHQRGFVVARRRLGEVLLGLQFLERKFLSSFERGQLVLQFFVFFVFTFFRFFVDLAGSRRT